MSHPTFKLPCQIGEVVDGPSDPLESRSYAGQVFDYGKQMCSPLYRVLLSDALQISGHMPTTGIRSQVNASCARTRTMNSTQNRGIMDAIMWNTMIHTESMWIYSACQ